MIHSLSAVSVLAHAVAALARGGHPRTGIGPRHLVPVLAGRFLQRLCAQVERLRQRAFLVLVHGTSSSSSPSRLTSSGRRSFLSALSSSTMPASTASFARLGME